MSLIAPPRDTRLPAGAVASAGAISLLVLVQVALRSSRGQELDDWAMTTVVTGREARLAVLSVLGYVSIGAIVAVVVGCVAVAVVRGRVRLAAAAAIVIVGANVTTQVLKRVVLERPDLGFGTLNSLPSGHTTVVASAVGAALLVAPRGARPVLAAAGGFATTLTGASTVVAGWHRPADVFAALAVSLAWTGAVGLFIRGPRHRMGATVVSTVIGCVFALVALVLVGVRPAYGWVGFGQAALVLGAITTVTMLFVAAAAAASPAE